MTHRSLFKTRSCLFIKMVLDKFKNVSEWPFRFSLFLYLISSIALPWSNFVPTPSNFGLHFRRPYPILLHLTPPRLRFVSDAYVRKHWKQGGKKKWFLSVSRLRINLKQFHCYSSWMTSSIMKWHEEGLHNFGRSGNCHSPELLALGCNLFSFSMKYKNCELQDVIFILGEVPFFDLKRKLIFI